MKRLHSLDYCRLLCVAMVFAGHVGDSSEWVTRFRLGLLGVAVFFVISGYLITASLLRDKVGGFGISSFYIKRICRILPPYWTLLAILTLAVPMIKLSIEPWLFQRYGILPAGRYLFNYRVNWSAWIYWYNQHFVLTHKNSTLDASGDYSHVWSLCVEDQFYALWPLLVAFLTLPKLRAVICGVVLPVSFASIIYYHVILQPDYASTMATLPALLPLAAGALITLWQHPTKPIVQILTGLILCIGAAGVVSNVGHIIGRTGEPAQMVVFRNILAVGIFLFFLFIVQPWVSNWPAFMRGKAVEHLGRMTYGFYLWHYPIIMLSGQYSQRSLWGWQLLATTVMATLSYVFIERPMTSFGHRWVKARYMKAEASGNAMRRLENARPVGRRDFAMANAGAARQLG